MLDGPSDTTQLFTDLTMNIVTFDSFAAVLLVEAVYLCLLPLISSRAGKPLRQEKVVCTFL